MKRVLTKKGHLVKKVLWAFACVFSASVMASDFPRYVSVGIGNTDARDSAYKKEGTLSGNIDLKKSVNFSAAFGYRFPSFNNVRAEMELSYREANFYSVTSGGAKTGNSGYINTLGLLVNGYYDFRDGQDFQPYMSGGIGLALLRGKMSGTITVSDSDTTVIYQFGAGASYNVTGTTAIWAGYRFLGSSDPKFDSLETEYSAHEFRVGVKHTLPN